MIGRVAVAIVIFAFTMLSIYSIAEPENDIPNWIAVLGFIALTLGFTWMAMTLLIERGLI